MDIDDVYPAAPWIEDKLLDKHGVTMEEVVEAIATARQFRQAGRDQYGEMRQGIVGQTQTGRWLTVFFVLREGNTAAVITAREATKSERTLTRR